MNAIHARSQLKLEIEFTHRQARSTPRCSLFAVADRLRLAGIVGRTEEGMLVGLAGY